MSGRVQDFQFPIYFKICDSTSRIDVFGHVLKKPVETQILKRGDDVEEDDADENVDDVEMHISVNESGDDVEEDDAVDADLEKSGGFCYILMNHRLFFKGRFFAFSRLTNSLSLKLRQFISKTLDFLFNKVNSYVRYDRQPLTNSSIEAYNLGLTGLYNLGNTCFMNSAIQCLVHTPQLVEYFLGDFRKDLNSENPLGMKGELALRTTGATSVGPQVFKERLSDFAPQFSGCNEHDSQEFLAFLLDGLHEDLNRVKIKPYNEIKDVEGTSDKEVADEYWRNHLARNDSIIVGTCQGQYRSALICPLCTKHSVTFDPFLYLSLPFPSTKTRTMTLTILSTDGSTLPDQVSVTVPENGKFKDLIRALSTACSLGDHETLLVAKVYNNHILHFLDKPGESIELVRDNDKLVAYRLLKDEDSLPLVVFTHFRFDE